MTTAPSLLRLLLAVVIGLGSVLAAVVVTATPAAAAPPLDCVGGLYLTDTGTGNVRRVDIATGTVSAAVYDATPAASSGGNQLGVASGGARAINTVGSSIVEYDAASGTATATATTVSGSGTVAGAINPANGLFYYGGYVVSGGVSTLRLYVYDPATDTTEGPVANITTPSFPGNGSNGANGDIAFDGAGRLYYVGSANGSPGTTLYRLDAVVPTTAGTPVPTYTSTVVTTNAAVSINGIAFGSDGYLYLGQSAQLIRVNPISGAQLGTVPMSGVQGTDLASCAGPSSLTVKVDLPGGRVNSTDQFSPSFTGGSYDGTPPGPSATTTGTDTGLQDTAAEFARGVNIPAETYTFSVAAAGTTTLSAYATSYVCTDDVTGATVSSGTGVSGTATVSPGTGTLVTCVVTAVPPTPPTATDDARTTPFQTAVTLPAATNDTAGTGTIAVGGTVLTTADAGSSGKTRTTAQGVWQVDADGTVTFTPAAGFTGSPSTGYRVVDDNGQSDTGTLTVTVRPGPSATADTAGTQQDVDVDVTPLGNDTAGLRADGTAGAFPTSTLRFAPTGQPAGATVSNGDRTLTVPGQGVYTVASATGVVTFDPVATFTGAAAAVRYAVQDQAGNPTGSTITITVTAVNPVANDDAAVTPYDTNVALPASTDDTPGPGGALDHARTVLTLVGAPAGSSLTADGATLSTPQGVWRVLPDGRVELDPATGFTGTTTQVQYRIHDTNGQTDTARLQVTVRVGPSAQPDAGSTSQNSAVTVTLLTNDTPGRNADGSAGSFVATSVVFPSGSQPADSTISDAGRTLTTPQGVWTADTTGTVTFDPAASFVGVAPAVSYTVSDSHGNPATSTATVTVTPVDPVADDDTAFTAFDTAVDLPAGTDDTPADTTGERDLDQTLTVFTSSAATDGGKRLDVAGEGVWTLHPDTGVATFTPSGFEGTTTAVEYRVVDETGSSDTALLAVTVRPGPSAVADLRTTEQDVDVTLVPFTNDAAGRHADGSAGEFDATSVVFPSTGQPAGATVSSDGRTLTVPGQGEYTVHPATGAVTFDPEPAFTGPAAAVRYLVRDQFDNPATSTVTVTVTPITPTAVDDAAKTASGAAVTLTPLGNDLPGHSSAPLVASSLRFTSPDATDGDQTLELSGQGTWQINAGGTVTFTPEAGFTGVATPAAYEVADDNGTTDTATLTVTVGRGPLADPEAASTPQNVDVSVDVVDGDVPGDQGTPCTDYPVNTAPAGCDTGTFDRAGVRFTATGGTSVTVPGEGTYTVAAGVVTFDPLPGFTGAAQPVHYALPDSYGTTASSTVTVTVRPIRPTATADTAATSFDQPVTLPAAVNDTPGTDDNGTPGDASDDTTPALAPGLTVFVANGLDTLTVADEGRYDVLSDGSVRFTPRAGFTGTTTAVTYRVFDVNGSSDVATLGVVVRLGPSALPDDVTTLQDVATSLTVLGNDTASRNPDDSASTFVAASMRFPTGGQPAGAVVAPDRRSVTVPGEGSYTAETDGRVSFDPEPAFTGVAAAVRYEATDARTNTTGSTVTVTVTPIVPDATDDTARTPFATPVTLTGATDDTAGHASAPLVPARTGFVANGLDTLTVADEGRYEIQDDGSVLFTPAAGYAGTTTPVRYRIEDDNGTTDTAQLQVTVRPGPVAVADEESTAQNVTVEGIGVLGNDTPGLDAAGEPGTFDETTVVLTDAAAVAGVGTWTVAPDGTVSFDPEPSFTGDAVVEYAVTDEFGNETTAELTVTVTPMVPVAADDTGVTSYTTPIELDVLGNDWSDARAPLMRETQRPLDPATGLQVSRVVVAGEGEWTVVDGQLRFAPAVGFSGPATPLDYTVEDANGTRVGAIVRVTVGPPPAVEPDDAEPGQDPALDPQSGNGGGTTTTPDSNDDGGFLPDTGGPSWLLLALGFGAVLLGAGLVRRSRREA